MYEDPEQTYQKGELPTGATYGSLHMMQVTGADRRIHRHAKQAAGVRAVIDTLLSSTARPTCGWAYMRVTDDTEIYYFEACARVDIY